MLGSTVRASRPHSSGRSQPFAAVRRAHTPLSRLPRAAGGGAPPASAAEAPAGAALAAALEDLLSARRAAAGAEELTPKIEAAKSLAAAAGADRVISDLNDGLFEGFTLTGRMTKMLSGDAPITLQAVSFGLYQPGSLLVRTVGGDAARVFKGERFGRPNAYVISTPLRLEEAGVEGVSHAVATYDLAPGNPSRLDITFQALRLEPAPKGPGDLEKWLGALAGANPGMDPDTGVLEVAIPPGAMPKGWMDYHAMTPEFQLLTGNGGSTTLLRRVQE